MTIITNNGGLAAETVTAASTNNYTPGMGFPVGFNKLYINPSTNDVTFTGMVGTGALEGQKVDLLNTGTTYNWIFSVQSSSSDAGNRYSGPGTGFVLLPGGGGVATYSNGRWNLQ